MRLLTRNNPLATWGLGILTGYWAFGFLVDRVIGNGVMWSAFVSASLLVFGTLLLASIRSDFVEIVRKGDVDSGKLAILGLGLVSFGYMWSGVFSLLYNYFGRPEAWIGSVSSFGRAMSALGLLLFFLAPEVARTRIRPPRFWAILIGVVLIALVGFFFGLTWGGETVGAFDTSRATKMVEHLLIRRA